MMNCLSDKLYILYNNCAYFPDGFELSSHDTGMVEPYSEDITIFLSIIEEGRYGNYTNANLKVQAAPFVFRSGWAIGWHCWRFSGLDPGAWGAA